MAFEDSGPSGAETPFRPRLSGQRSRPAPYNTNYFYVLGLFGGPLALAFVALANLSRLPDHTETTRRTFAVIGVLAAVSVGLLAFAPLGWWEPRREIHFAHRFVAVLAGAALDRVQRGPANAAMARADKHSSIWHWQTILPVIALAYISRVVVAIAGLARGLDL